MDTTMLSELDGLLHHSAEDGEALVIAFSNYNNDNHRDHLITMSLGPLGLNKLYAPRLTQKISALAAENLCFVVERLIIHEKMDESIARRLEPEFLRFVGLRMAHSGVLVPSPLVDEFWHNFILYTEEYMAFCNRNLGRYMHHRPQDHSKSKEVAASVAATKTVQYLKEMFPAHNSEFWAEAAICSNSHCDSANCGCP